MRIRERRRVEGERSKEGKEEAEEDFTKDRFINNHQLNKGHHRDFANFMARKKRVCKCVAATCHNHGGHFTHPPVMCELQSLHILTTFVIICIFLMTTDTDHPSM